MAAARESTPRAAEPPVDPSNVEQARAWDGDEGAYWAAHAARFDQALAPFHQPLLDAAGISATHAVLDIGCGTGQTTRDAARAAHRGNALGVDLSAPMVDLARQLARDEGVANVRFEHADAQVHPFEPAGFDVAISRTGSMFFGDPPRAFANIAGALCHGGRLALLTWQAMTSNEWILELSTALAAGRDLPSPPPGAPGPFSLAEPAHVQALLSGAGFENVRAEGLEGAMCFGADEADAFTFVVGLMGWMLDGLGKADRAHALDALAATIAAHRGPSGVAFGAATWLVTARRA